jgi:L-asparaginase II
MVRPRTSRALGVRSLASTDPAMGCSAGASARYRSRVPTPERSDLLVAPRAPRANGKATTGRQRTAARSRPAAPVLVRVVRSGVEESVHRGHVIEAGVDGHVIRALGDPEHLVTLRSTVKPFGLVALIEAGGVEAFDLSSAEIAILASSHSGEDLHVRTLQGLYRRARVAQGLLACGSEGAPLDELTAARLARDGEKPSPIRHMCSGQHSVFLLLSRLKGWDPERYWEEGHPAQVAYRSAVARAFGVEPAALRLAIDGCGIPTYAFTLRDVARAYAMLAEPAAVPTADARRALAPALTIIRDAMMANPELVAGSRDRLDTSLMKAVPGRLVSKSGMEALRGVAILRGPRSMGRESGPTGMAVKIDDGDGYDRGTWAASIEALRQAGVLDTSPLRQLARYHRPVDLDPHGRLAAESIADFELVPVGELLR